MTPSDIEAIADPAARARAAQDYLDRAKRATTRVRTIRDGAIVAMRTTGDGLSQRQVAKAVGLTPGRVAQIDLEHGVESRRVTTAPGVPS